MEFEKELAEKINTRTKPIGSLGKLEEIAYKIGVIQKTLMPELKNPVILVFAGDHGLADEGVSPCPREITHQMVLNFVKGGAGINIFSRQHGINLKIIDAGVDYDFRNVPEVINAKIARGTKNMIREPAMTIEQCFEAIEKGSEAVRNESEKGCNVIGFGEMGIGNSSAAALLLHKFVGIPLSDCVGRGVGLSDEGLKHKYEVLKTISGKYNPEKPLEILATFGGFEIAMICGAVLEAKKNNMLIIADGFIATSAFVAAYEMQHEILENVIFSHLSDEKGHAAMLKYLNGEPLLRLNLRLGEGTGVALAYPLIKSAVLFLNEMASFKSAAVSEAGIKY